MPSPSRDDHLSALCSFNNNNSSSRCNSIPRRHINHHLHRRNRGLLTKGDNSVYDTCATFRPNLSLFFHAPPPSPSVGNAQLVLQQSQQPLNIFDAVCSSTNPSLQSPTHSTTPSAGSLSAKNISMGCLSHRMATVRRDRVWWASRRWDHLHTESANRSCMHHCCNMEEGPKKRLIQPWLGQQPWW